ncbi:MAG: hypothetical protein P1U64_05740 [Alcanivoracaceae bacterium]|nr:hypothetical protein [Alcanivoracaceae bacterium]
MSLGEITQLVTIIGVLITALALLFTIHSFKKQLQLNFFAEYTRRYQEIILNLPETINQPDFNFDALDSSSRDKSLRYMRAYFDLCSEEYFLRRSDHIGRKTWQEWKAGMEFAFSKTAFQDAWDILSKDTIYYGEFSEFVEKNMDFPRNKEKQVGTP